MPSTICVPTLLFCGIAAMAVLGFTQSIWIVLRWRRDEPPSPFR